jgi:hypothetical protein
MKSKFYSPLRNLILAIEAKRQVVVSTDYDSKEDIGTVVVQYNYEVSNAVKRKTGQMETFLVFGTVSKQPKVILITEHNVR